MLIVIDQLCMQKNQRLNNMRLVSCVGLLMVIPAIALLTHRTDTPVNKPEAVETPQEDKKISIVQVQPDSVQLSTIVKKHLPAQNHLGFTSTSTVKSNPVATKQ